GAGDNAVIVSPAYGIFENAVRICGGEARFVPLAFDGAGFGLDLDRVRAAIDRNTRMLIVNSPNNPTGWRMSVSDQRALYALALERDVMLLADEVYERLVFDDDLAPSFARIADPRDHLNHPDRLIVVNSFSK